MACPFCLAPCTRHARTQTQRAHTPYTDMCRAGYRAGSCRPLRPLQAYHVGCSRMPLTAMHQHTAQTTPQVQTQPQHHRGRTMDRACPSSSGCPHTQHGCCCRTTCGTWPTCLQRTCCGATGHCNSLSPAVAERGSGAESASQQRAHRLTHSAIRSHQTCLLPCNVGRFSHTALNHPAPGKWALQHCTHGQHCSTRCTHAHAAHVS